ncbi:Rieske [2Fe-2S] domain [Popillia japonica]|uniref:Rieske [2Fe-2S] domain n=1 Tax=Popillia japonica TaxID=7064 RepID=A0AAW1MHR9_POPJA
MLKNCVHASPKNQHNENYVEDVVCKTDEIGENEMKSLDLGEGKILLIKQNGKLSAIGAKCTHYGAPLSTGALGNGRVRCPWHGACFNITTGDIEDFPVMKNLRYRKLG